MPYIPYTPVQTHSKHACGPALDRILLLRSCVLVTLKHMKKRSQIALKLAATGGAFLVGGPLASLAIGAVASPEFLQLTKSLLGESGHHVLTDLPAVSQHFIQHVTAHLFGGQLHELANRGPNGGYNHDLRRGMVLAIHNALGAQIGDLNVREPRYSDAWGSSFNVQFLTSIAQAHRNTERHLRELFRLWIERLQEAIEDETGRRLDELFPRATNAPLPADSSQFDEALAEAANYFAAREGKANVWNDIFDRVLAPLPSGSSAAPSRRWFGFGPLKAEPGYERKVRTLLDAIEHEGIAPEAVRVEVIRFLQHHFPSEFAEVVKSEQTPEHRKAWIAYQKLMLETTRAIVIELPSQIQSLAVEQRKRSESLVTRVEALAGVPKLLEQIADSAANIVAVVGQESRTIQETVREESAKLANILAALDSRLDHMPGAVADELEKLGLVRPAYVKRKLDRIRAVGTVGRLWPVTADDRYLNIRQGRTRGLGQSQIEVKYRFPIGSRIRVMIETVEEKHLLLLDESPNGTVYCLCPSLFAPDSKVSVGRTVLPTPRSQYKSFVLTGPEAGQKRLIAILTSKPLRPDWSSTDNASPARVLNSREIDGLIVDFESQGVENWTVLVVYFEVTPR